jgi:glycosyltransferase involved in cell wall biosynthesis
MNEKVIDIIIPAWKAQKTLPRLLSSIASQTIIDLCKITVVNDCDGIGYDDIVTVFKPLMDISVIDLTKNCGPGVARQTGIDKTSLPYIVFADSDDSFMSSFSLQTMYEKICNCPTTCAVLAEHYLEVPGESVKFVHYKPNYVWVFGKIYRRAVLEKYSNRFNDSRANEDVSFNMLLKLSTIWNEEEKPVILNQVVYSWHHNPNSITRSNEDFSLGENITGYVDNVCFALKRAYSMRLNNKHYLQKEIISLMARLYIYCEQSLFENVKYFDSNLKAVAGFYNSFYNTVELTLPKEFVNKIVIEEFDNKKEVLGTFIPKHSFEDFLSLLREFDF